MSQQSQTTDATKIDSQRNSWDFPEELPGQSMGPLGTGYLKPIPELLDGDSASALSGAPGGMLTRDEIINLKFLKNILEKM